MLFFAYNTSPLYNYLGVDSGMFLYIGQQLSEGKLLYSQIFDHKGPLIFIINMLPQLLIKSPIGVFIIEVIFAFCGSVIMFRISKNYISTQVKPLCLIAPLLFLIFSIVYFNGGNYTEEYTNLFSILTLLIFDNFLKTENISRKSAFLVGFSFAFAFFLRPNNMALILSVTLFIFFFLIKKKSQSISIVLLFGFLGILSVTLPIFIYHLAMGTFDDMLYGTILHNLTYCNSTRKFLSLPNAKNGYQTIFLVLGLFINLSAIFCTIISSKFKMTVFLLLSNILLLISTSLSGYNFLYYQTLFAPILAYSSIHIIVFFTHKNEKPKESLPHHKSKNKNKTVKNELIKDSINNISSWSLIISVFMVSTLVIYLSVKPLDKKTEAVTFKENAQVLYSYIPMNDRNNIFCYDIGAEFLYQVNAPCNFKYFTMQSWMSKTNPQIKEDCSSYVEKSLPKYLITEHRDLQINRSLQNVIDEHYKFIFSNDIGYLYVKN